MHDFMLCQIMNLSELFSVERNTLSLDIHIPENDTWVVLYLRKTKSGSRCVRHWQPW